eukprot:8584364-Prorocentrum_lima.AAC.1
MPQTKPEQLRTSMRGHVEIWKSGDPEIRRLETWRSGDVEIWRRDMEIWRWGDMEIWRYGD